MSDRLSDLLGGLLDDFKFTAFAMEQHAKLVDEVNFPATMNLRDALSHIHKVVILALSDEPDQAKIDEQRACAREHIRRAAVEPIQELFTRRYREIVKQYTTYIKKYIHLEDPGTVDHKSLRKRLSGMLDKLKSYRFGKNGEDWQAFTSDMYYTYDELNDIGKDIQGLYNKAGITS